MKIRLFAGSVLYAMIIAALFPPLLSAQTGESENLRRVTQTLTAEGIPFERRQLSPNEDSGSESAVVRSNGNALGTFVLAIPLDADFAVDAGLAAARKLRTWNHPINILIAFLGNESASNQGLRNILALNDVPENWMLAYLDIDPPPERLFLHHGARGNLAPLDIVKPLVAALQSSNLAWALRIRFNGIYKLALVEGHRALNTAWGREINGFALTGRNPATPSPSSTTISPQDMADVLLDYAASLEFPTLKADKHYVLFAIPGGKIFLLDQRISAVLLLAVLGVSLLLFLIYSAKNYTRLVFRFRLFFRSIWVFLLLIAFLVVSITAASVLYSTLFQSNRPLVPFPDSLTAPEQFIGAGLTLMLSVLLFFLHSPIFAVIRIPQRAYFYGFSSIIFAVAGTLAAAFSDFSLVPAFLWATFFIFLAASLPKPKLIFICVAAIPLFAVAAVQNIIQTGSLTIAEFFISPNLGAAGNWLATLQIALFCLPLILLIKRGVVLSSKPAGISTANVAAPRMTVQQIRHERVKRRLVIVCTLIAVVLVLMLTQIALV
ncbi:MAG: hypothetical protein FWD91_04945 [Treponema sp.]|nr:hypothetical protein [Treponema sp.]